MVLVVSPDETEELTDELSAVPDESALSLEILLLDELPLVLLFFDEAELGLPFPPQPAVIINAIQRQIAEIIRFFITTPHLFF